MIKRFDFSRTNELPCGCELDGKVVRFCQVCASELWQGAGVKIIRPLTADEEARCLASGSYDFSHMRQQHDRFQQGMAVHLIPRCFGHYDFCEHRQDKKDCPKLSECVKPREAQKSFHPFCDNPKCQFNDFSIRVPNEKRPGRHPVLTSDEKVIFLCDICLEAVRMIEPDRFALLDEFTEKMRDIASGGVAEI